MTKAQILLTATALIFGSAINTALSGAASPKPESDQRARVNGTVPHIAQKGGCQTEVHGETVQLFVGQSVEADGRMRTCEVYDGHPVIVFASKRS